MRRTQNYIYHGQKGTRTTAVFDKLAGDKDGTRVLCPCGTSAEKTTSYFIFLLKKHEFHCKGTNADKPQ